MTDQNHSSDSQAGGGNDTSDSSPSLSWSEHSVVWTIWLTYGAFYFCRTNISAAVPGMKESLADGGLGLTGHQIGLILASLKMAYGIGQLINGQFAERISPRILLAIGMFCSAGLNVLFGFSSGFYFLLFVWACNGYCQSLGWTPCVRVVGNWIPISRRGKAIGIIGTGYQITLGLTFLIAGLSAEYFGWRAAMYVPALFLAAAGIFTLVFLKETPEIEDGDSKEAKLASHSAEPRSSFGENVFLTLFNPTLWLLGLSLGLLNACRYGFLDWGLTHLMEVQNTGIGKAGLKFFVIAIGAAAGAYLSGWATDRFFGARRAPVICILLILLGILTLIYESVVHTSPTGTVFLLIAIGFCIYGPQVLLVGTAPADLAHGRTAAAAAGFVNFMGYMGAATGDVVTGHLSDKANGGWHLTLYVWAGWAFAAALFSGLLWNVSAKKVGLLGAMVPKLVACGALATAAGILLLDESMSNVAGGLAVMRVPLFVMTVLAVLLAVGSLVDRRIAMPNLGLTFAGFLFVFIAYVVLRPSSHTQITLGQATTLASYGISLIASVMILVERR